MPDSLEVSTSLHEIWDLKSHAPEKLLGCVNEPWTFLAPLGNW